MNLRLAIAMAAVCSFNATYTMQLMDVATKKATRPSFHSLLTFGLKKDSNPSEYADQIKVLSQLTPDHITDPKDQACARFFGPKIEQRYSELAQKVREAAAFDSQSRKSALNLRLTTSPRILYTDITSFYFDAVIKNQESLESIPVHEQLAALNECRQFFKELPAKEAARIKHQKNMEKLHEVHGTLASQSTSLAQAVPHLRAVVDIHPTNEVRHAFVYALLGVAHEKTSKRAALCHEAKHNLAQIMVKQGSNDHFRYHTLLSAELSNLSDDFDETIKMVRPLRDDPSGQMYAAAAHFFKKDYSAGCKAVATACKSAKPSPELLDLYKRSRCEEAMIPIWKKIAAEAPLEEGLGKKNRKIILQLGNTISQAEKTVQA
jgi:hypothetical protein